MVELCKKNLIIRYPQKLLLGFAIETKYASTFIECIEMCFEDRKIKQKNDLTQSINRQYCKSIMYFYEVKQIKL